MPLNSELSEGKIELGKAVFEKIGELELTIGALEPKEIRGESSGEVLRAFLSRDCWKRYTNQVLPTRTTNSVVGWCMKISTGRSELRKALLSDPNYNPGADFLLGEMLKNSTGTFSGIAFKEVEHVLSGREPERGDRERIMEAFAHLCVIFKSVTPLLLSEGDGSRSRTQSMRMLYQPLSQKLKDLINSGVDFEGLRMQAIVRMIKDAEVALNRELDGIDVGDLARMAHRIASHCAREEQRGADFGYAGTGSVVKHGRDRQRGEEAVAQIMTMDRKVLTEYAIARLDAYVSQEHSGRDKAILALLKRRSDELQEILPEMIRYEAQGGVEYTGQEGSAVRYEAEDSSSMFISHFGMFKIAEVFAITHPFNLLEVEKGKLQSVPDLEKIFERACKQANRVGRGENLHNYNFK